MLQLRGEDDGDADPSMSGRSIVMLLFACARWGAHARASAAFVFAPHSERAVRGVRHASQRRSLALRSDANDAFDPLSQWPRLGLSDEMFHAVRAMGLAEPSDIQRQAIPQVMKGDNLMVAAETGSGKTLAYMIPVIQSLRDAEVLSHDVRQVKRPRAVVLVPTRELADQVLGVTKSVGHVAKVSACGVMGGDGDFGRQKKALGGLVDVVVASPGRLLKHRQQGNLYLSQVTHVVIDEVDTMLTQGFGPEIEQLLRPLLRDGGKEGVQFVLTTATVTKAVRELLAGSQFPPVRFVESAKLHRTIDTLQHDMADVGGRDKLGLLLETLQMRPGARTMIFCNTVGSCRAVEHFLAEQRFPALCYHGEMNSAERRENIAVFKAGKVASLVCTDLAARGLDMPVVAHVVMFDFPQNPIDYLHRSGRTGRMGSRGMVTSLVAKRDRVLATAIEHAIAKGLPIDTLTSNKADYVTGKGRLADVTSQTKKKSSTRRAAPANRNAQPRSTGRASTSARQVHEKWARQESSQERKRIEREKKRDEREAAGGTQ